MTAEPKVKGWCPGAHRPMLSGDGYVVRVRPRMARLDRRQALGLCALASEKGNGVLELTNRANLQLRGVGEADLQPTLAGLAELGLLDDDPTLEGRRNILTSPFWRTGEETQAFTEALEVLLPSLGPLPPKFGFAVDLGPGPVLGDAPADLRIERGGSGPILRADSMSGGRPVTPETVGAAVLEMVDWFKRHRTPERRRMAAVLATSAPPRDWAVAPPMPALPRPRPGECAGGALLGAPFGQIDPAALADLMHGTNAVALRTTPWRLFLLEEARMPLPQQAYAGAFITAPDDPLLAVDACPGSPCCADATVETRALARRLASGLAVSRGRSLHVSGCLKGCARAARADVTLVGRDGHFDLVLDGTARDRPARTGLSPAALLAGAEDLA